MSRTFVVSSNPYGHPPPPPVDADSGRRHHVGEEVAEGHVVPAAAVDVASFPRAAAATPLQPERDDAGRDEARPQQAEMVRPVIEDLRRLRQ